jgi:hypothetical protein
VLQQATVDAIRTFLQARKKYESEIDERHRQPGGSDLQPQSLRLCIDPDLLDGLIILQELGCEVKQPADVSDAVIRRWMQKVVQSKASTIAKSDLDSAVKNLRINMQERDPEQRVVQLFIRYHGMLGRLNRQSFTTDHPKDAVEHIVSRLHPAELKFRVSEDLAFDRKDLRKDFLGFFEYCKTEAENCEGYVAASQRQKNVFASASTPGSGTSKAEKVTSSSGGTTTKSHRAKENASVKSASQPRQDGAASRVPPDCLNTHCSEKQYLSDCANTSEQDKKILRKAYYDAKKRTPPRSPQHVHLLRGKHLT